MSALAGCRRRRRHRRRGHRDEHRVPPRGGRRRRLPPRARPARERIDQPRGRRVRAQFSDPLNIAIGLRSIDAFTRFAERPGAGDRPPPGRVPVPPRPRGGRRALRGERCSPERARRAEPLRRPRRGARPVPDRRTRRRARRDVLPARRSREPEAVVQGYAAGARGHGASVLTGCAVTRDHAEGRDPCGRDDARRDRDRTGRLRCRRLVAALAAKWASSFPSSRTSARSASPVRPQGFRTASRSRSTSRRLLLPPRGARLLFGMADPDQPPGFDAPTDPAWLERVMQVAERRLPAAPRHGHRRWLEGLLRGDARPQRARRGVARTSPASSMRRGSPGTGSCRGRRWARSSATSSSAREPFVDVAPLSVERFASASARPEHNVI